MKIHLTADADRIEGKTESGDKVAEALVAEIEGASLDVGDSVYEVVTVEAEASKAKAGASMPRIEALLFDLSEAFFDANPVVIDGPSPAPTPEQLDHLRKALSRLVMDTAVGELANREKQRRLKAAGR